jgi:hypothetical protein
VNKEDEAGRMREKKSELLTGYAQSRKSGEGKRKTIGLKWG